MLNGGGRRKAKHGRKEGDWEKGRIPSHTFCFPTPSPFRTAIQATCTRQLKIMLRKHDTASRVTDQCRKGTFLYCSLSNKEDQSNSASRVICIITKLKFNTEQWINFQGKQKLFENHLV